MWFINLKYLLTGYVDTLMNNVLEQCSKSVEERQADVADYCTVNPPPLCSEFHRPDKEVAVEAHMTRFRAQHPNQ